MSEQYRPPLEEQPNIKETETPKVEDAERPASPGASREYIEHLRETTGERDRADEERVRAELAAHTTPAESPVAKDALSPTNRENLNSAIAQLSKDAKWQLPALFRGNKTATNYDSRAANFSTQTKIVELPDGQRLFLVNNYRSSWVHRGLDTFMKWATDCHMKKAASKEWKKRFESKSRIPIIPNEDPNTIVMPFVPNINVYDLIVYRDQMKDVGECDFAKNITADDCMRIVEDITNEIKKIHNQGIAWGELILPNMIIDTDQKIHICDPEVSYDEGMPLDEQKARDVLDFIISSSAALPHTTSIEYGAVVQRILDTYDDPQVISTLKQLAQQKMGLLHKIFFGYDKARLGLKDAKEYEAIKQAISEYIPSSTAQREQTAR